MTAEDEQGWWDVPAATGWTCPECHVTSPTKDWADRPTYCEDCGEHDGRACPACDEVFDHVWGAPKIAEAMRGRGAEA